ncbi:MAG: zinc ribbon domain-containing protein [Candidatus Heimdallarchaeaceae archaeon]
MAYAYVQPIKPIAEIKQEFRKYARNIGHSLIAMVISMVIVTALAIISLFLVNPFDPTLYSSSIAILSILLVFSLILAGIGIYKMVCEYKLSKTLDDLGLYYMQETTTAKKAGEMLKIALLVSIIAGGIISLVVYIIAYHRVAETFKELNKNELFPKQESRLVYKSFIASIIVQIMFLIAYGFLIIDMLCNPIIYALHDDYYFSLIAMIFVGISSVLMVAVYIVQILAFYRLGDDVLLIVERQPSSFVPVKQPFQSQPVQYSPGSIHTQSIPSGKFQKDQTQKASSYCPNCGNPTDDVISFCTKCGTKLD